MRRIAIIGAAGRTGQELVKQAVMDNDWQVIAIVRGERTAQNFPEEVRLSGKFRCVQVNLNSLKDLSSALKGCTTVLSCISNGPSDNGIMYRQTCNRIVLAMKNMQIRRLVAVTSWFTDPLSMQNVDNKYTQPVLEKHGGIHSDMLQMEQYLDVEMQEGNVDFVVVRVPVLFDAADVWSVPGPFHVKAVEGQWVLNRDPEISRAALAQFMLHCVTNDEWKNKYVAVAL